MTYATLLVPVEAEPQIDHRLALAIDLANQFDARLIGVGAEMWRTVAMGGDFDVGYATGPEHRRRWSRRHARQEVEGRRSGGAPLIEETGVDWPATRVTLLAGRLGERDNSRSSWD
jgi:hypothetical protein